MKKGVYEIHRTFATRLDRVKYIKNLQDKTWFGWKYLTDLPLLSKKATVVALKNDMYFGRYDLTFIVEVAK